MKSYDAKNESVAIKSAVKNCIAYHEKYRGCYFWTSGGSAGSRRSEESKFSSNNPEFEIIDGKNTILVAPSLSISARNFYYHLVIKVNNVVKDIRAIKKYL